jgi:16S rRNA (uracil1498-N3)-methyltransferase
MQRFFIPPNWIQGNVVTLTGPNVHQIRTVLRLQSGDEIVVLDNSGWEYQVRLSVVDTEIAKGDIVHKSLAETEPRAKITLYQSILKGDRFEWVLQKGTEVGAVEFVPIVTDRCVIANVDEIGRPRLERWERIVREAAEQSHRGRLPRLQPALLFPQACERARRADLALVPWEEEKLVTLRSMLTNSCETGPVIGARTSFLRRPFSISVFIGPEGGFTSREIDQARRYGLAPVSLGPRILRAETAAVVSLATVLYHLEDA